MEFAFATSSTFGADKITKLTPNNYQIWSQYVMALLQANDLDQLVTGEDQYPPDDSTTKGTHTQTAAQLDWIKRSKKARVLIVLSVSESMLVYTNPSSLNAKRYGIN